MTKKKLPATAAILMEGTNSDDVNETEEGRQKREEFVRSLFS